MDTEIATEPFVRPARLDEIAAVREVARAAWADTYRGLLGPRAIEAFVRAAYRDRSLARSLEDEGLLVLDIGGRVRGYLRLGIDADASTDEHRVGRLQAIYLHPDEIGRGHGGRMWLAARTWFAARRAAEIVLEVAAGNTRARGFYEHLGFVPVETKPFEILGEQIDEMTYRLVLG